MQIDDLTAKAKSGLKWTVFLRFSSQIITWVISLLVIRFLSPEDYSIVSLSEVLFSSLFILCTLGLHEAIIQKKNSDQVVIRKVLGLMFLTHMVVSAGLWLLSDLIAGLYNNNNLFTVLRAGAVVYLVTPWLNVAFAELSRGMEFKRRGMVDLIAAISTSIFSLILAVLGFGFWALIAANFSGIILRAIGYNLLIGKLLIPSFNFSGTSNLLKFGLTVVGAGVLSTMYVGADVVVAGWSASPEILGSYAMAMFLAIMPMAKLMPLIYDVVFPYFSAIREEAKCIETFKKIITLASFFSFPFFFLGTLVVEEFVLIFLGEKWKLIILPMQIVLVTIPLRIIINLMWPLVRALGYSEIVMNHMAVSLVMVAAVVFFVTPYGINWIAASWLFTTPILFVFAIVMLQNKVSITASMLLGLMYRPLSISIFSLGLTLYFDSLLDLETSILHGIVKVFLFVVFYAVFSWFFNRSQLNYSIQFRLS